VSARHARSEEEIRAQVMATAESFEAQWGHSLRMAQGGPKRSLQDRVNEYVEARRQDNKDWEKEEKTCHFGFSTED
jgi:hypothetical protein